MIFRSSKILGKKIKVGDDVNHDDLEAVCHDFLNEAGEDILFEIFIRLRFGSVCHRWHSLISHDPQFIPRFISHHHQHQDRYSLPPYAIIFRKADKNGFPGVQYFQPICKLFSEESMSANLEFLPSLMVIRASCNDLLLVSPCARWLTHLYICNPITKQFVELPEIPRPGTRKAPVAGHALVCMPGPTNQFRFKVLEFHHPRFPDPESELPHNTVQPVKIFCSESGEWKNRRFPYPRARRLLGIASLDVVTCNGILYWLEYERCVDRIVYLDLSSKHGDGECGVIDLPYDSYYDTGYVREQIGAVRVRGGGELELRLLQVVLSRGMASIVHLKVWKLNYDASNKDKDKDNWVLVHHKKRLKRPENNEGQQFVVSIPHPANGDVVFMVWGQNVFQYNLINATTYEMIGQLQEPLNLNTGFVPTIDRLLAFPMVHPTWPMPLPTGSRPSV